MCCKKGCSLSFRVTWCKHGECSRADNSVMRKQSAIIIVFCSAPTETGVWIVILDSWGHPLRFLFCSACEKRQGSVNFRPWLTRMPSVFCVLLCVCAKTWLVLTAGVCCWWQGNHNAESIKERIAGLEQKLRELEEAASQRHSGLVDNSAFLQFMWKTDVVDSWIGQCGDAGFVLYWKLWYCDTVLKFVMLY